MSAEKRSDSFVFHESGTKEKPIEFTTFLLGLASTAVIHLGQAPHPETGMSRVDLPLARQSLELLGLLRKKTAGNLEPGEEKFFDDLLADLRLRYVEAAKR